MRIDLPTRTFRNTTRRPSRSRRADIPVCAEGGARIEGVGIEDHIGFVFSGCVWGAMATSAFLKSFMPDIRFSSVGTMGLDTFGAPRAAEASRAMCANALSQPDGEVFECCFRRRSSSRSPRRVSSSDTRQERKSMGAIGSAWACCRRVSSTAAMPPRRSCRK